MSNKNLACLILMIFASLLSFCLGYIISIESNKPSKDINISYYRAYIN